MDVVGQNVYLSEGLTAEHYPLLLDWIHDLEVMQYIGWAQRGLALQTVEQLKSFIAELEGGIIFGIYTADDRFIGYTSLADFTGKKVCEYGIFILDKHFWGKGIGSEVTRLMLEYAFATLQMESVMLTTSESHVKAIRMYEQAGFRKIRIIPDDRTIFQDGVWVRGGTVEMKVLRTDHIR